MAAAGIIEVIGVVSGILGIIQFGMDNFADQDSVGSSLKVAVGLDYDGGLSNAGGDLPDVRLFNEGGEFIGMVADPGSVDDGSVGEITVEQDSGQQATYALFSANDNAICVAYVSITWPDGNQYGWPGDWGEACGGSWYYSNIYINGGSYSPKCLWIDANGDQPQTGFSVHFPEFVTDSDTPPADKDTNYFCNSAAPFSLYTEPDPNTINYWPLGKKEKAKRSARAPVIPNKSKRYSQIGHPHYAVRRNETYSSPHTNRLVIDNDPSRAAAGLCESSTSVGPDFANVAEGQFCRMADKSLWAVCSDTITDNCFNYDSQQLIVGGVSARDTPYISVIDWTSGGS